MVYDAVMKKPAVLLLVAALVLSGCASSYVIKLRNGNEVVCPSKPKLEGNFYHIKDAKGGDHYIPTGRVMEIEPASMARAEQKPLSVPTGSAPHKRHWYFLWLF
jgi:Prokaryotic membrane lipoprotein lipid attachment site